MTIDEVIMKGGGDGDDWWRKTNGGVEVLTNMKMRDVFCDPKKITSAEVNLTLG